MLIWLRPFSTSANARPTLATTFVAILLATSSCGVRSGENVTLALEDATRLFEAGYSSIHEMYITQVDLSELAVAGLNNMTRLDPDVNILQTRRQHMQIAIAGTVAGGFDWTEPRSISDWAAVTAEVISLARTASPELAEYDADTVYKIVFDGMIEKLDPFSRYSPPQWAREHHAQREGFGGIGVRFAVEGDGLRVSSVMKDGPGARAGFKPNDLITHVDGEAVTGFEPETIHQRLRGSIGSQISVTLVRPDGTQTVTLTRTHIVPETVAFERRGSVAHIRLYSFNQETTHALSAAVKRAKKEIGPELAGFVLDLRDNPGGLFDQAVRVSDLFMESGRIISMHGRHPDSDESFDATEGDIADGLPVVVLMNGNSASASEIVAAALQDSGRAVVAGTTSYGKGIVQTVIPMPNHGELTLSSAQVLAPSGYRINHLGVLPSLCTAVDNAPERILDALENGEFSQLPITLRNSARPEDTPVLDNQRSGCPPRKTDEPIDVDVAVKLVENGALYRTALDLAAWPGDDPLR